MTRTFGAALGMLIVLLFLAEVATSLSGQGSDSLTVRAATSDR